MLLCFADLLQELEHAPSDAAHKKEVRMLKKIIASLEDELLTNKTKYQRSVHKIQSQVEVLAKGILSLCM